jgi:hypothetical protein
MGTDLAEVSAPPPAAEASQSAIQQQQQQQQQVQPERGISASLADKVESVGPALDPQRAAGDLPLR